MNKRNFHVEVTRLDALGDEPHLRNSTAEERLGMMWQLAQDTWAFMGEEVAESRLPRHLIRILKLSEKKKKGG